MTISHSLFLKRSGRLIVSVVGLLTASLLTVRSAAPQQPPSPLTTQDSLAIERTTLADARVRAIVGAGRPRLIIADAEFDKADAEAFLADTSQTPPLRRLTVVVFNMQTNKAARAVVSLAQNRILAVQRIPVSDVPFVREDADQALALAKGSPAVRRAVGDTVTRFEIVNSGAQESMPFAAQALPLRSINPRDPCSVDRCLDLIFRTANGYLPVRAHVDLTKRTVTVEGRGRHP